jgi:hypothetical protein
MRATSQRNYSQSFRIFSEQRQPPHGRRVVRIGRARLRRRLADARAFKFECGGVFCFYIAKEYGNDGTTFPFSGNIQTKKGEVHASLD